MKNTLSLLAFALATVLLLPACKKAETAPITKTINVSLHKNQSYTYSMPAQGDADDVMSITQQAQHYSVSTITYTDNKTATPFNYTPALDYVGTDEVHVSITEGAHHEGSESHHEGGAGHHDGHHEGGDHGQCHHSEEPETNYIFKIVIDSVVVPN